MANTEILKALKKILPSEDVSEVSEAVEAWLEEAKEQLENEYNEKLEEAYNQLAEEVKEKEEIAYKGYQEAAGVIQQLRNHMETQKEEFEAFMEENYKQAVSVIKAKDEEKEELQTKLYGEMTDRVEKTESFVVEKMHEFLQERGAEIYEVAKRDILNDSRMAEHRVVLDKIVENISHYLSDDDLVSVHSSKVDELGKQVDELKRYIRITEAKNVRLDTEAKEMKAKLNEANASLKAQEEIFNEQADRIEKIERKERARKAEDVRGRGKRILLENDEEIIPERKDSKVVNTSDSGEDNVLREMQILAGLVHND